jgi:hypothetical protein
MTKDERESKAAEIRRLWLTGEWKKSQIAKKVGCSAPHVTQVIARMEKNGLAGKIISLWQSTDLTPDQIARRCGCGFYYVQSLTRGVPRELLCQRPDVKNGLKPCGRPRHRLRTGDLLGVCEEHWNMGRPIGGQKL